MNNYTPKVLYEDNHLIIANKPAGYLSQGDATRDMDMIELTKQYIKVKYEKPGKVFLGLAHRLDRPTSGALVMCRTSKALSRMTEVFRNRAIKKTYHAIIDHRPEIAGATLTSYLKKDEKKNRSRAEKKPFPGAKKAILSYQQIAEIGKHSLLEITLETGRPHQIRAQLAQHKMPILGDMKYKPQAPLEDKSIALHCYSLEFIHPVKKEHVRVTASYPNMLWWNPFRSIS